MRKGWQVKRKEKKNGEFVLFFGMLEVKEEEQARVNMAQSGGVSSNRITLAGQEVKHGGKVRKVRKWLFKGKDNFILR